MKIFRTLVIAVLLLAVLCGCKQEKKKPQSNSGNKVEAPQVYLERENKSFDVFCGETFTIGRCYSGDILFVGNAASVFREKDKLYGCMDIFCGDNLVVGLTADGSTVMIGKDAKLYPAVSEWKNIVKVVFGDSFVAALDSKGKLYVESGANTSDSAESKFLELGEDTLPYIDVAAYGETLALVCHDGRVVCSDDVDLGWTDIKNMSVGKDFIIGLKADGSVVGHNIEVDWKNAVEIGADADKAACITGEGKVLCTKEYKGLDKITNASSISFNGGCLSVVLDNGRVEGFGKASNMQTATDNWRLLFKKYTETGYITGFAPQTTVERAIELLSLQFKGEITVFNGKEQTTDGYVGTGMTVKADGKKLGTVLLYGDVNGDGEITTADATAITSHREGETVLKGIYLNAADTRHYMSGVSIATEEDMQKILAYCNGEGEITQFVYDPYAKRLKDAYKINSDVIGYMDFEGTNIDYPILYGANDYYDKHTLDRRYSERGAIYSVYPAYQPNNIVVGHNARVTGTMFHQLHRIQNNKENLKQFKDRVYGVTLYREYGLWELFAIYETPQDEPFNTQYTNLNTMKNYTKEQKQAWIDNQIARSEMDFKTDTGAEDTILTVYTCGDYHYHNSDAQARLYLFFRRVG